MPHMLNKKKKKAKFKAEFVHKPRSLSLKEQLLIKLEQAESRIRLGAVTPESMVFINCITNLKLLLSSSSAVLFALMMED